MSIWARLLLAIVIGAVVGVATALIGNMFGVGGATLGGVAGGTASGIIAVTLRGKAKA